ncbi:hypothetical protein IAT38_005343 [Cryptococcus sp. DSM 104549]
MSPQAHPHAHQPLLSSLPPAHLHHHHHHQFPAFSRPSSYSSPFTPPTQPTPIPSFASSPHTPQPPHMLPTPAPSSSPSPPTSRPAPPPPSHSNSHRLARPKPLKKPSASTGNKHRSVQMSLEVKVEKAKGFHAFFVPLCKGGVPPAPPCSPVHAHGQLKDRERREDSEGQEGEQGPGPDYFGAWTRQSEKERDEWVENAGEGMEVDGC